MNERIKELAEQAFMVCLKGADEKHLEQLERFAELVRQDERNLRRTKKEWSDYERAIAADEREACAKLCEQEHDNYLRDEEPDRADGAMWCVAVIRGRTG